MIGVVQRVSRASVSVAGKGVASIGIGLVVLVGVSEPDTRDDALALGSKVAGLRVFADEEGLMNLSASDVGGDILVVSQFTLLGETRQGRRPSFTLAAAPDKAAPLIEQVQEVIAQQGVAVRSGVFGAHMTLSLVNDGPVTLIVRTEAGRVI